MNLNEGLIVKEDNEDITINERNYLSLLDISREIQSAILQRMNRFYWIKAEIAKLNYYHQSGHCYPQLVEKRDNKVMAEMRATIWANDYRVIVNKFQTVTGEQLSDGMTILCYARVNYHPVYGLALQIADIDPSFTLGEMAVEREKTIRKLKAEGLWDANRDLEMPMLPKRLAVISVETSKGYHDFRNIIDNNKWGYNFHYSLFPALLQGDKAVASIKKQLEVIGKIYQYFDVVLIIRGGGGDVGLSCYDNYELAKSVATFPVPIITGIGHSTNKTVVEMVSHTNSITPTDVAYSLIQHFHNFTIKLDEFADFIINLPQGIIEQEKRHLDDVTLRLTGSAGLFIERSNAVLKHLATLTGIKPMQKITIQCDKLDSLSHWLVNNVKSYFNKKDQSVNLLEQHAKLLDPINILKRGYSIARLKGKALRSAGQAQLGDEIEITLSKGVIETIVKKKKK